MTTKEGCKFIICWQCEEPFDGNDALPCMIENERGETILAFMCSEKCIQKEDINE